MAVDSRGNVQPLAATRSIGVMPQIASGENTLIRSDTAPIPFVEYHPDEFEIVAINDGGLQDDATIVNGKNAIVYLWYDNEFGYSCQVVRCLEEMAGVRWAMYPTHA